MFIFIGTRKCRKVLCTEPASRSGSVHRAFLRTTNQYTVHGLDLSKSNNSIFYVYINVITRIVNMVDQQTVTKNLSASY